MRPTCIALPRSVLYLTVSMLLAPQARAELYKCSQPDGQISYQQTACAGSAEGVAIKVDRRGPAASPAEVSTVDYSVETQLRQMRTQREQVDKERKRQRTLAAAEARQIKAASAGEYDAAKCAKQRAKTAKWKQKVLNGYRTRSEKDRNENKLAHHRALADRYCD